MIFRVDHNANYTTMCNRHLRDKRLSLKAKGLLSLMLSLPDEWDYSIGGLVSICAENQSAVESTLRELRKTGYLVVTKLYPNETKTGRIEYLYDVHEYPVEAEKQGIEKQGVEIQGVEIQGVENRPQLNTNISNNEQLNTDYQVRSKRFTPPTLEEVKAYCKERKNNVDADRWMNYYTANGWKVGKNSMKDWKAAVRTWERGTAKHFNSERSYDDDFFARLERRDNGTAGDN